MIEAALYALGLAQGIVLGYIWWAPRTPFKDAFLDGITFAWIWDRNRRKK